MGNKGTIVDVAPAYFRNVLQKKNLAKQADNNTINMLKQKEEKKQNDEQKRLQHIYDMLDSIEKE
jgi:ribosomal protein L9